MKFLSTFNIICLLIASLISCIHSKDNQLRQFEESVDVISKLCESTKHDAALEQVCGQIGRLNKKISLLEEILQEKNHFSWPQSLQFLRNSVLAVLPESDQQCSFDWNTLRCSPICSCEWKPLFGDLSPNRACRLRSADITDCSIVAKDPSLVHSLVRKFFFVFKEQVDRWTLKVLSSAPFSDDICFWSFKSLSCEPSSICEFSFQFGDYALDRACRIVTDRELTSDEIQSALLGQ
jgi:hypothetical protein